MRRHKLKCKVRYDKYVSVLLFIFGFIMKCLLSNAQQTLFSDTTQSGKTIIVTVTTQLGNNKKTNSPNSSVPSSVLGPILHLTCFAEYTTTPTKGECCLEMSLSANQLCSSEVETIHPDFRQHSICRKLEQTSGFESWCNKAVGTVPPIKILNKEGYQPVYYVVIPNLSVNGAIASSDLIQNTHPRANVLDWHQSAFDSRSNKWYHENHRETLPFHLSRDLLDDNSSRIFQDKLEDNQHLHDGTFSASVDSSLSSDGGMHRHYRHKLQFFIPNHTGIFEEKKGDDFQISGDFVAVLPLTEGLFLDVDNPFQEEHGICRFNYPTSGDDNFPISLNSSSCKVSLIVAPNTIIDIEQPSFASPQNVVAFQVSFKLNATPQLQRGNPLEIEFIASIHMRYQSLIFSMEENQLLTESKNRAIVYVPPLFLVGGQMIFHPIDKTKSKHFVLDASKNSKGYGITSFDAAAGIDSYHDFVAWTTAISVFIGSLIIMADISKVTLWC